ncbi:LysR family transcriptional regulator [Halarcobacter mediterraneus]|uniref:LysR family transcriptional regulator n=1 Tax=Halarcobacter mediterraneus TaxID=2023153 RepID=A0A4Q1AUB0_9BACT|nr:LysR family transcriptional regulator [Halarcobacter mediterraneus]RXK12130.1 LysR family transcriptional regulator [Halarcobacter mediterraneus]
MDSTLLRVFVVVAQEKTITLAAKKLGFAQSNVTSRIKQLEKSLGYTLFHRVPKGVILTHEGEKLYKHAIEIVKKIENAVLDMQNIQYQKKLVVGSTDCNAAVRISSFLMKLHKDHPEIQLELLTGTTRDVIQMILNYKVDIAFISGEPVNDELIILKKFEEEIAILEPQDESSPNVILSFKEGCAYDEFLKSYYLKKGEQIEKSLAFGSLETILACVKAGMGKTLLPTNLVDKLGFSKELKITKLNKKTAYIPTCLICRKDNIPKIADYLKEIEF